MKLKSLLGAEPVGVGDLILAEVLQGCLHYREFSDTLRLMSRLDLVTIAGHEVAVEAARNYIRLRALGVTVRKTIDTLIATRCILSDFQLLHNDRDFDAFERHLGLSCVPAHI
jgi:predicted nucleic acid-binding protein